MTFVLGLTGSIATGKSTALAFFEEEGIPVYSADAAVHELYAGDAAAKIEAAFPGVVSEGAVDRQQLAQRLVGAPEKLARLEAIVHPLVRKKSLDFIAAQKRAGAELAVIEIPLLFETATAYPLDAVAVTWCPPAIQRQRALRRPGMTVEKLNTMLARQMPQAEKQKRADFLIETGGSKQHTHAQVRDIIARCRQRQHNPGARKEQRP